MTDFADGTQAAGTPRVVLVTGSSGAIGAATVAAFQERGLAVAGFDLVPPRGSDGPDAFVAGDCLDEGGVAQAVARATELGQLRHVVHIAGGALPEEVSAQLPSQVSLETFRASVDANLTSAWVLLRAVEDALLAGEGDRSVTLCSSRNALSGHGIAPYSAAKAALMGMIHPVAVQLGRYGVRVNAVAPGQIATPYARQVHSDQPGHFERIASASALGRLAVESEVADAFVAVALQLRATTGQLVVVDGGGEVWR